jgi:hypothetical protein
MVKRSKMKIQKKKAILPTLLMVGFWMILLLPLLLPNPVSASTVASGLTYSTATTSTHQRKSFYAKGRYWVFYSDGTNMVFKTSVDGISWSSATTVRAADNGNKFSVFFDGTYVHYAYSSQVTNTPLYYCRGTPDSNGTVTWSSEQTAVAAASTVSYTGPCITVATDGRAWIGYEYYTTTGPDRYPCVTRNANTDGTWSTDTGNGFPYQLSSRIGGTSNVQVVQPVPLTSGYVLCLYTATGFQVRGKKWDGSWGSEKLTSTYILGSNAFSAVNEGDDVHLCLVTGSNPDTIYYEKYTHASDSFGDLYLVQGSSAGGVPAVSLDTTTNTLYCFWRSYNNSTHIYYKRRNSAGTWDSNYTDWIDESTDGIPAADRLTAFYKDYGGKIGLLYMAGTSSPNYKVNFAQLSLTGATAVVGKPMVVYSEEGQTAIKYSKYSSGAWAAGETATDSVGNVKYWKVAKTHPAGRKRATVFLQENTAPRLYATLYDDSQWDDGTANPFNGYGDSKDLGAISAYYRCFDAAYEQLSGRLMVVAATAPNTISYWTWDAGTWSGPTTYAFTNTMATIYWIKIAAKPASNEITLVAADSTLKANALVWNGSAWGNESNLTSSLTTNAQEAIGVEYIRAWGDIGKATVFWATANTMNAKMWNGSSWGSTVSKGSLSASIRWLRVKADPNSDRIAVGYEDNSNAIYVLIWDGSSWFTATNLIDSAGYGSYANHRPFDVIYETGASGGENTWKMGHVLVVYADTTELRYRHCSTTGSSAMTCAAEANVRNGATTYQAYWVQLERAPDNTIHLAIHDTNEDLVTWTWNNVSWTYKSTISSDLERDANHNDEVFALFPMPEARAIIISSTDGNSAIDYSRYHDGAAPPGFAAQSTSYPQYWKVVKSSADGSKQVAVSVDFGGTWQPHLWGTIYNGSSWSTINDFGQIWSYQDWDNNYVSRHRAFDAAFETSDGHIVVVATDSSTPNQCYYWTHNGSTWSSATALTFTNLGFGYTIKWVKLASNPNASSNEIALIVSADNGTYKKAVGKIWNGSAWGNEQLLTSYVTTTDQEAIAVEYMQTGTNGGKALFAWAETATIYGRVWNGSGWDSAQSKAAASTIEWLRLAADPASYDLMLGYESDSGILYALKWTGAAWDTSSPTNISESYALTGNDEYNRAFDVIWESGYGHTGHAIIVFSLATSTTYSKHYDGSSWGSMLYMGEGAYWIELARATDNAIHMITHDYYDHLTTATWNNSAWSYKSCGTGIYIESNANYGLERGTIRLDESNYYNYTYNQVISITPVATTTPQIQAIDFNFGAVGAPITIYGVGFGNAQGSSTVKFYNNQTATVTSWSDVKIVVTVPSGTASGYLTVTRGSNSDTICFSVPTGPPVVSAILPNGGSNFSDIDIAYITGSNFSPGATVKLKKSGQSDITATNVTVVSSARIEMATFNITSAATGLWNVEVTNPDSQSGTLANAFAIHVPYQVITGTQANYADLAYPNERHLIRDSNGNWYYVFYSNENQRIYITRSTDGGVSWDSPTTLVGTGGIITTFAPYRDVSVDVYRTGNIANDRIHIVWRRGINSDTSKYIYYSRCIDIANYTSANSWKRADETTNGYDSLDSTSFSSEYLQYPDIAVDSAGYPHVAWNYNYSVGSSESIRYRTTRPSGTTWASTVILAAKSETPYADIMGYPSIDTDSNNYVHVSFSQYYNTSTKYLIRYAKSTNYTSFTKTDIIADSSRNFYQSSLVVDSNNKIYVAALDDTNKDLFWAHYNGSTWSTNNNLTNGSIDIESAVVGAKVGSGTMDHVLVAREYSLSSSVNMKIIYWRWDSTSSNWNKYSEFLDTGNESSKYISIEKHAPASSQAIRYLFYDNSGDRIYFDGVADIGRFEYKRKITLNCSGRGDSCSGGLSNFPILIDTTNWPAADKNSLKTVTNGGHVYYSEGYDIIFRASDQVTQLPHEIEKYDGSTGTLIAWVKVDPLFNNCPTTGTDIYMYYGNTEISSSTENPTGVWDSNYKGVWHLKEDPSGTSPQMKDSKNTNHGTSYGSMTSGDQVSAKVNGGLDLDGSDDYIDVTNSSSSLNVGNLFTVEMWIKRTTTGGANEDSLLTKVYGNYYSFKLNITTVNNLQLYVYNGSGYTAATGGTIADTTNFHYIGGYADGTNLRVFRDGVVDPGTFPIGGTIPYDSSDLLMGVGIWGGTLGGYTDAIIDEVRISNVARDACWIETTYRTISSPSYTLGPEQEAGPTLVKLASFTAKGDGSQVRVEWVTKTEIDNVGFNLYRSTEREGTYQKLNSSLIPGLISSAVGKRYTFMDANVVKGRLYYYKLEDIDLRGTKTMHGPICVDWDGDGIPDDQDSFVGESASSIGEGDTGSGFVSSGGWPVTRVKLRSFRAEEVDKGVLIEWETGHEVNNLGFHVYREENGELYRLTPDLIAGSAMLAGSGIALGAGHSYQWLDISLSPHHSSLSTVRYWLEDIDLSGRRTLHGPVEVQLGASRLEHSVSDFRRAEVMSELGRRLNERYEEFWRVQELREKLALKRLEVRGAPRGRDLRSALFGVNASNLKAEGRSSNLKPSRLIAQSSSLDTATQRSLASRSAIKLLVREEGWYRVSVSELEAAGLSSGVDPRSLRLYTGGVEVPLGVVTERRGRSVFLKAIEFYGVGLDTSSTDTRVYWLVERPGQGLGLGVSPATGGAPGRTSFPFTVERKDRVFYFAALRNGEESNFFGPIIYQVALDQILELRHLDLSASGDALLEVRVQGATDLSHRVALLVNGVEVGTLSWEGQTLKAAVFSLPQSSLMEGENLVSLVPLGGEMDVSVLDSIRLTYWRLYRAYGDELRFEAQGGTRVTIDGFSTSGVRVFDITDPLGVIELKPMELGRGTSGVMGYGVTVGVSGSGTRTLLALTEGRVRSPVGVVSNRPSRWYQERSGYDLVILSHGDFMDSLEPLKRLREIQGLRVGLIDIEDLYDEFSFGIKTPKAIKDFLSHAKTRWWRSPRYVLLVGDASFDPRNYLGLGDMDYVPTKLIDTAYMETASDDWFVDLNDDGLPEIAIGRLPVQTPEEATIVVSKIVGYEKSSTNKEALLVADRVDSPNDFNFEGASEGVRGLLPVDLTVRRIYRGQFESDAQAKGELLRGINEGPLLVNFIGHGSVGIWRGSLLTLEDADNLVNGLRLPFFINMTCLNGFFQNPYGETLAEALIKASGGGAIAIWTSSGLTEPDKQAVMNKELIRLLFGGDSITLGEATARAKSSVSDQDVRKTWILFGDPSTQLK